VSVTSERTNKVVKKTKKKKKVASKIKNEEQME